MKKVDNYLDKESQKKLDVY